MSSYTPLVTVNMKVSPILQCTLSLISPIRISGPLVSNNIAAFNVSNFIK